MFIDFTHSMLSSDTVSVPSGKQVFQTKNRSLDTLALEDDLTLQEVAKQPVKKFTAKNKTSKLKRSSVVLDNTLLRDYNLAINHFENDVSPLIQNSQSNNSISSTSSKISSLFSSNSCISIHDLLFEELVNEQTSNKQVPSKELIDDDFLLLFNGKQKGLHTIVWDLDDELFNDTNGLTRNRTNLEFD